MNAAARSILEEIHEFGEKGLSGGCNTAPEKNMLGDLHAYQGMQALDDNRHDAASPEFEKAIQPGTKDYQYGKSRCELGAGLCHGGEVR